MPENMFVLTYPDYDEGAMLNFYNETVSVVAAKQYEKDGEVKSSPKFCLPDTGYKKYSDRPVPMGVRFSNANQARKVLTKFLDRLGGPWTEEDTKNETPFG